MTKTILLVFFSETLCSDDCRVVCQLFEATNQTTHLTHFNCLYEVSEFSVELRLRCQNVCLDISTLLVKLPLPRSCIIL